MGGLNDSLRLLRSFGMASIELRDANMNELQLADGVSASLTFNIPTALQAEAPQTIDWWSFDETLGYWKHEGEAQKTGTQYVGAASHFSWWNVDVPENFNDFNGTINSTDGNPITDAQVNVVTPTMGTGITYTNAEGVFSGRVPKNQTLTLNINLTCSTTNDWVLAYSENIPSGTLDIDGIYSASLDNRYPITGTAINCNNETVEDGYVKIGSQVYLTNEGAFNIQTCSIGEYSIQAFDTSNPDSIRASELIVVQVGSDGAQAGSIQACLVTYGTVADMDGNSYSTVLIGGQWWMAENLRSATYGNGDLIPNGTEAEWTNFTQGAWIHYESNSQYENVFGKLYNVYAVTDPRNVCPTSWHVPSEEEWNVLINFLGGEEVAGGKMKSVNGWNMPNTGATNESGFSGRPSGAYSDILNFSDIQEQGFWWSSNISNVYNLYSNSSAINTEYSDIIMTFGSPGLSVRCLKDE